ncbi:MAG: DUF4837 family protein [Bacteroidales bacterium]|nr:DUF4837 family protein [Bacteroidales bacterium]
MRKLNLLLPLLISLLALFSGCKNTSNQKPNITGAMGEVLVVMDDKWRNGPEGEALQQMLKQPMEGLPQVEPIFNVSITPHRAFGGSMRTFRNLVITNIGPDVEKEGVRFFSESSWARDQSMIHINAKTPELFLALLDKEEVRILGYILRAERQRSIRYYTKFVAGNLTDKINQKWGMKVIIPNIFTVKLDKDDFSWMSHETPSLSQGMFIYSFDYKGEGTFSREYLLNKRDSVLRRNVPGPSEGSYMSTEHMTPVTYKSFENNGHKVVELRGLWKVVGDLMGGPFVMHAHLDKANNRVVVTDGYVFLPEEPKKRNYIWQLESLFYSVDFGDDQVEAAL